MVSRIRIERREVDYRWYHTTVGISDYVIHQFSAPLEDKSKDLEDVGKIGGSLLKMVFSIPGVKMVFISPYCLSVMISKAFNWLEVEPAIIEALEKTYQEMGEKGEVKVEEAPLVDKAEDSVARKKESLTSRAKKFFNKHFNFKGKFSRFVNSLKEKLMTIKAMRSLSKILKGQGA